MKVLITGATGLVGTKLVDKCLEEGISVHYLTTDKEKIINEANNQGFYWNPKRKEIDKAAFKGVNVIIHLAGATIAKRWTKSYKKVILESRTHTAKLLYDSLKEENHTITHFISASGIGIYPNSEINLYTEESNAIDSTFLAKVVVAWEKAANQFSKLGMDVAVIRTGMVLSKKDGVLPKLVKTIKLGIGAPIGSGEQWHSWIHIEDLAGIYVFALKKELEGVYNAVAPGPVTNKRFVKQLAVQLHKSVWLPNVPAFVLKLILGEMSVLALEGQLVGSKKIEEQGFMFRFSKIEPALQDLL
jgi:hypothetical protein